MKAGDLERNLTRLVEVTKAAQACLATLEGEVSALRVALHSDVLSVSGAPGPGLEGAAPLEAAYK